MTSYRVLEEVPGILSAQDVTASAQFLLALQRPSGQIPWVPGGHCDPWNQVESAMALTATGHDEAARAAFTWLERTQRRDGSWFNYYVDAWVSSRRIDTNVCAYVATGVWHYLLVTGDRVTAQTLWPMVERAISFALRWQRDDGAIAWSLDERGVLAPDALLTGSSSILQALRCGARLAEALAVPQPAWTNAANRVAHVIAAHPERFLPKPTFAMDWYYPVLSGAVAGERAHNHLRAGWDRFVLAGRGVRCVHPNDWVTAAETAECVLALDACGLRDEARALFALLADHRRGDGGYLTGWVYPQRATFPRDEATSYSVAAVLLAADALMDGSAGAGIFRHQAPPPSGATCRWCD